MSPRTAFLERRKKCNVCGKTRPIEMNHKIWGKICGECFDYVLKMRHAKAVEKRKKYFEVKEKQKNNWKGW